MWHASYYEYKCAVEWEHAITNNEMRKIFQKSFITDLVVQAQNKSSPLYDYI